MIVEIDGERFDVPDDATPDEIGTLTAPAPNRPGMGDLRLEEAKQEAIRTRRNVPAYLLTGYPIDEQRARAFATAGKTEPPLTARQAAQGMALVGSVVAPPLAAGPLAGAGIGGGLFSLGTTKATTPLGAAVDTATGALTGAGTAKVLQAAGSLLRPAGEYLTEKGIKYGRKALSGVTSSLARRKPIPEEAVREALDIGAIRPGSTVQGIAQRLQDAADPLSERYAGILKQLEAAGVGGPKAREIAVSLLHDANAAVQHSAMGGAGGGPYAEALRDVGESIAQRVPEGPTGRLGLMQAEEMKRGLQARAASEYVKEGATSLAGAGRKETAARMRQAIEDAVKEQAALAPQEAAAFEPVKAQLHRTLTALGAAREGAARYARRSPFGLHEAMGLASGIASGNPLEAVGAAGLMSALKERGASTLGSAFYGAGNRLMSAAPQAGPVSRSVAVSQTQALVDAIRRRMALEAQLAAAQGQGTGGGE